MSATTASTTLRTGSNQTPYAASSQLEDLCDATLGEHLVEQAVATFDQQALLGFAPRLRRAEPGFERDLARARLHRDAGDQPVAEKRELRAREVLVDRACDPVAPAAAFASHDVLDVLPELLERDERLVLVLRHALLEHGVLLNGDAHQPDDHVGPVRRLTARDPLLCLPQLDSQRFDGRDLREAGEAPPGAREAFRPELRIVR